MRSSATAGARLGRGECQRLGPQAARQTAVRRTRKRLRVSAIIASAVGAVGVAAAATLFAVGGAVVTSTPASAAFSVKTAADGDVTIRIHELTDADALEAALADHGITAEVDYAGKLEDRNTAGGRDMLAGSGPDEANACQIKPDGTDPLSMRRDAGDYVVTLAAPAHDGNNRLHRTTATSSGNLGLLMVTYMSGSSTCSTLVALK